MSVNLLPTGYTTSSVCPLSGFSTLRSSPPFNSPTLSVALAPFTDFSSGLILPCFRYFTDQLPERLRVRRRSISRYSPKLNWILHGVTVSAEEESFDDSVSFLLIVTHCFSVSRSYVREDSPVRCSSSKVTNASRHYNGRTVSHRSLLKKSTC